MDLFFKLCSSKEIVDKEKFAEPLLSYAQDLATAEAALFDSKYSSSTLYKCDSRRSVVGTLDECVYKELLEDVDAWNELDDYSRNLYTGFGHYHLIRARCARTTHICDEHGNILKPNCSSR